MKLWSNQVFLNGSLIPAAIETEGSLITKITPRDHSVEGERNLEGFRVLPGLIDSHIHGCAGADTMDATFEALNTMSCYLVKHGVTSFCPTTVTAPMDKLYKALHCVKDAMDKGVEGAKILGSYVEGPYITVEHKGAHPEELIRELKRSELEEMLAAASGTIRTLTLAPEKEGAVQAIAFLCKNGIRVSLGHSSANSLQVDAALAAGANTVVHLYNGMAPLHHREPGLLGTALIRDCYTEIICDGFHVKSLPLQIAARCKAADRMILITDCMRAGGMPDGEYTLGELEVRVAGGAAYLKDGGSLAGSTLSLDRALINFQALGQASFAEAVLGATANPATALGVYDSLGSLTPGKRADIIALDNASAVRFVTVDGKLLVDEL
ncbi:MAG: N-acetylglucosamine-6-phosphate deacetylase [Oscillospiraceae bacterium]